MWKSQAMLTEVAVLRMEQSGGSGTKQRFLERVKNQRNTEDNIISIYAYASSSSKRTMF